MTTDAAAIRGLLRLTLLAVLSRQAAGHSVQSGKVPTTCEGLSTSLIENQLSIMQLIHDSSNASCAAVEIQRKGDAVRKEGERLQGALGAQVDRVQATLEARQRQYMQQMLDALNRTAEDILTKVEELREQMREEVANAVMEAQITPTTLATEEPTTKATDRPTTEATQLPEGTVTSLCDGNKTLHGTVGALQVVSNGTYSWNTTCSWDLHFPTESSVSLVWEDIDVEYDADCSFDWVTVYDVTNSKDVYGGRLCGRNLSFLILQLLNVNVPRTRNLLVTFHSDDSAVAEGFRLLYRAH